jgi:hypothetical protein
MVSGGHKDKPFRRTDGVISLTKQQFKQIPETSDSSHLGSMWQCLMIRRS